MGGSRYDEDFYASTTKAKLDRGDEVFEYSASIKTGGAEAKVHEKLDPKKLNTLGKLIRESFDSDAHPESMAVAFGFDVTGSMLGVPRRFVSKLDKFHASLVKKGFLAHPHILFAGIGDATIDKAPLQVGQFEAGNEMDEALSLIFLEGGGGALSTESYELFMYFMARHTDIHCLTKRDQKGYCFISGDEIPYSAVKRNEVKAVIGDDLQEDIPLVTILEELRAKFHVHWIMPGGTNHWGDSRVTETLQGLFGQDFHRMENPDDILEMTCSIIGVNEGFDLHDVGAALVDVGSDTRAVDRVTTALAVYASNKAVVKSATATGALVTAGGDSIKKL